MNNLTLQTFLLAMIIVVAGTLGLSMMAEATSKLRTLEDQKIELLTELSELREEKVESKTVLLTASGAYFSALDTDRSIAERIEAKRTEINRVERLIMAETGEDFTKTDE